MIPLAGTIVRHRSPSEADGRANAFEILNISGQKQPRKSALLLAASSSSEANLWIEALQAASRKGNMEKVHMEYESLEVNCKSLLQMKCSFVLITCYFQKIHILFLQDLQKIEASKPSINLQRLKQAKKLRREEDEESITSLDDEQIATSDTADAVFN